MELELTKTGTVVVIGSGYSEEKQILPRERFKFRLTENETKFCVRIDNGPERIYTIGIDTLTFTELRPTGATEVINGNTLEEVLRGCALVFSGEGSGSADAGGLTMADIEDVFLTVSSAEANYLKQADAANQYRPQDTPVVLDVCLGWINGLTVTAGSFMYYGPGISGASLMAAENVRQVPFPTGGKGRRMYVKINAANASGGTLVVTARVNGVDTALVVTIPNGAPAGTYSNLVDVADIPEGALVSYRINNNGAAASPAFGGINMYLTDI